MQHKPETTNYFVSKQGFTLIELMIVVAIIGLLASIALPAYRDYVQKGRAAEATSTLAGLKVQMDQYFQDFRTYQNAGAAVAPCSPPAGTNRFFNYNCSVQTAITYEIRAVGIGAQDMGNFAFTINQDNAKTSLFDGTAGGTCWLTSRGGTC